MKNQVLSKVLATIAFAVAGIAVCALYVIYLPLAIVRVVVNTEDFGKFLDCVDDFVNNIVCWFRKEAK